VNIKRTHRGVKTASIRGKPVDANRVLESSREASIEQKLKGEREREKEASLQTVIKTNHLTPIESVLESS
jgi:hypothetical protein